MYNCSFLLEPNCKSFAIYHVVTTYMILKLLRCVDEGSVALCAVSSLKRRAKSRVEPFCTSTHINGLPPDTCKCNTQRASNRKRVRV